MDNLLCNNVRYLIVVGMTTTNLGHMAVPGSFMSSGPCFLLSLEPGFGKFPVLLSNRRIDVSFMSVICHLFLSVSNPQNVTRMYGIWTWIASTPTLTAGGRTTVGFKVTGIGSIESPTSFSM